MIRRTFLTRALSAAVASLFARNVSAQKAGNGMQDMPGMSDMPSMSGGKMHMAATLAPADALPAGAPLAVLRKLTNESSQPGVFLGTLVAQPVQHEFLPGKPTTFWQYGNTTQGPVVGPLIDVREGDTVEIDPFREPSATAVDHPLAWSASPARSRRQSVRPGSAGSDPRLSLYVAIGERRHVLVSPASAHEDGRASFPRARGSDRGSQRRRSARGLARAPSFPV